MKRALLLALALGVALARLAAPAPHGREGGESVDALTYLQSCAAGDQRLPALVDAFERMCGMAIPGVSEEDTLLLFETGVYDFTGEALFYFSLVRQYPGEGDEFIQLRLEAVYAPTEETRRFRRTDWNEGIEGDFFAHVRASEEYAALKDAPPVDVTVHADET